MATCSVVGLSTSTTSCPTTSIPSGSSRYVRGKSKLWTCNPPPSLCSPPPPPPSCPAPSPRDASLGPTSSTVSLSLAGSTLPSPTGPGQTSITLLLPTPNFPLQGLAFLSTLNCLLPASYHNLVHLHLPPSFLHILFLPTFNFLQCFSCQLAPSFFQSVPLPSKPNFALVDQHILPAHMYIFPCKPCLPHSNLKLLPPARSGEGWLSFAACSQEQLDSEEGCPGYYKVQGTGTHIRATTRYRVCA